MRKPEPGWRADSRDARRRDRALQLYAHPVAQGPPDRVWEVLGNPGASIGPDVDVQVERAGAADGTGMIRVVKVGRSTIREEISSVGPGQQLRYRMLDGAPIREYVSDVALAKSPNGGTTVRWDGRLTPRVPGSGPLIRLLSKRTLNRVLDAIDEISGDG